MTRLATVATTWELAFEKVREKSPSAADLLCMLAFFAPEGIRVEWFTTEDEQIRDELPQSIAELTGDNRAFNQGLASLQKYSLVTRSGG